MVKVRVLGGCAAMPVVHAVGKDVLQRETGAEVFHIGLILMQRVDIGAVSLKREIAVQTMNLVLGHICRQIMDIGIVRHGQYAFQTMSAG